MPFALEVFVRLPVHGRSQFRVAWAAEAGTMRAVGLVDRLFHVYMWQQNPGSSRGIAGVGRRNSADAVRRALERNSFPSVKVQVVGRSA